MYLYGSCSCQCNNPTNTLGYCLFGYYSNRFNVTRLLQMTRGVWSHNRGCGHIIGAWSHNHAFKNIVSIECSTYQIIYNAINNYRVGLRSATKFNRIFNSPGPRGITDEGIHRNPHTEDSNGVRVYLRAWHSVKGRGTREWVRTSSNTARSPCISLATERGVSLA